MCSLLNNKKVIMKASIFTLKGIYHFIFASFYDTCYLMKPLVDMSIFIKIVRNQNISLFEV